MIMESDFKFNTIRSRHDVKMARYLTLRHYKDSARFIRNYRREQTKSNASDCKLLEMFYPQPTNN